ncbi:MAG: S9 family peptidase, partial [Hyphomicrobiaceae bacterium]
MNASVYPPAPIAQRRPEPRFQHGTEWSDDYAWLRAGNWQEVMRNPSALAADIRAYLEAENDYTAAVMADTVGLQDVLFEEMKGRIKEDDSSVPSPDGPWDYYTRFVTGGQYPLVCRRPRGGGPEQIVIDGNAEALGKPYWGFAGGTQAPDHRLMAYGFDDTGSEFYSIRIRNMATGLDLEDEITNAHGHAVWSACSGYLFYVRYDEKHRPLR